MTMSVGDDLHLRRPPARAVVAFERLQKALVEEAILLLRRAALFQIMNAHVEWLSRLRVLVRSRVALLPVHASCG